MQDKNVFDVFPLNLIDQQFQNVLLIISIEAQYYQGKFELLFLIHKVLHHIDQSSLVDQLS